MYCFFLLQFTCDDKPHFLLSHFGYHFDERCMHFISNSSIKRKLNNFMLIIAGVDIDQAEDIKRAVLY